MQFDAMRCNAAAARYSGCASCIGAVMVAHFDQRRIDEQHAAPEGSFQIFKKISTRLSSRFEITDARLTGLF